ncbi:hypothetical protein [Coralloluteibacterium thermophilus]|uniref:Uncharacterized protein n=1 Tax=Coralloluteibacterium thermophilum TaxID=2707049 RepID=A0ABV9NPL4_9GAMM
MSAEPDIPPLVWGPMVYGQVFDSIQMLAFSGPLRAIPLARVQQRVGGDWLVGVNQHYIWERRLHAVAPSERLAMRWAERWAEANRARLYEEVLDRHRHPERYRFRPRADER